MMPHRTFYVRYSEGHWLFGRKEQAFEVFDRKRSAVARGLAVVDQAGDVELVVLRKDGRIDLRSVLGLRGLPAGPLSAAVAYQRRPPRP